VPAEIPQDVRHVITFKSVADKTELTVTEHGYPADWVTELSRVGMNECLDKMTASLTEDSG
jgi:hypothetical protein